MNIRDAIDRRMRPDLLAICAYCKHAVTRKRDARLTPYERNEFHPFPTPNGMARIAVLCKENCSVDNAAITGKCPCMEADK